MKHEKMIQSMDLMDEKFIAEADPANAKNIKNKRIRSTVLRIGSIAACAAVVIGGIFWINNRNTVPTFPDTTDEVIYEVKQQAYVKFDKTLEECIAEAEYIVRGTVSEIKAAVLEEGYALSADMSEENLKQTIKKIYTPITFIPEQIYKAVDIESSEKASSELAEPVLQVNRPISFKGRYGTYQGYRLSTSEQRLPFEEDQEYILFLYKNNAGYLSIWHQPSLVLRSDGTFSSMMNNKNLYENFESIDEIFAYFELLE